MIFLDAIHEAHKGTGLHIHNLTFANLQEFETFIDSFDVKADYPRNIVVPFTSNGRYVGPIRKATIPLTGWMMTKIDMEDMEEDLRSAKVEKKYMEPMRRLAVRFLSKLLQTDIIDAQVAEPTDSIRPEYYFLSQRLIGVGYTMNVPVEEGVC